MFTGGEPDRPSHATGTTGSSTAQKASDEWENDGWACCARAPERRGNGTGQRPGSQCETNEHGNRSSHDN